MPQSMQITAATIDPALLDLPWEVPLEAWPAEVLAALPRGLSRHIVRFVNLSGRVIAVKEIGESVAHREYELLRSLVRLGAPCVTPTAVITDRADLSGEPLNSVLITEHLAYSLPYRALFSQYMRPETATRLIDALAVLLVRLHLLGFYWGDVSLSNTLFRRDAGAFAAYLVDAETGELHTDGLTEGKRLYDIDIARTNIIGELMDLQAGALLEPSVDTIEVGDRIVTRYTDLWNVLTAEETFPLNERWRVRQRVERLNELGFDVGELSMKTTADGLTTTVAIQPKVVDAGHYPSSWSPTPGSRRSSSPRSRPCPWSCAARSSRRRYSTRSWSTAGTCPRPSSGTCPRRRPSRTTCAPCCPSTATSSPTSPWATPRRWPPSSTAGRRSTSRCRPTTPNSLPAMRPPPTSTRSTPWASPPA